MDGKSGAPWYSGLPLKAMPDFAWMANIFEHDRISPKRHQCCAHQAAEILGSSRFTGKGGYKNGMAGPFRFVTRFRRCLCCSALLRWRRRGFTLPVLAIIVLRGLRLPVCLCGMPLSGCYLSPCCICGTTLGLTASSGCDGEFCASAVMTSRIVREARPFFIILM